MIDIKFLIACFLNIYFDRFFLNWKMDGSVSIMILLNMLRKYFLYTTSNNRHLIWYIVSSFLKW